MGFLDRLLGRKKAAEEPQKAPEPAPMPQAGSGSTGQTPASGGAESGGTAGEHSHEGER